MGEEKKFKVGDWVRVKSKELGTFGKIGRVIRVLDRYVDVELENFRYDEWKFFYHELELITQKRNTITLILGNTAYEITGENITIKTKQL